MNEKFDYVEFSKQCILKILNNDGNATAEGCYEKFEIRSGNKKLLLEHLKAITNIMNKAIEIIEKEDKND